MMNHKRIIESIVEPHKENLWFYKGVLKWYGPNGWVPINFINDITTLAPVITTTTTIEPEPISSYTPITVNLKNITDTVIDFVVATVGSNGTSYPTAPGDVIDYQKLSLEAGETGTATVYMVDGYYATNLIIGIDTSYSTGYHDWDLSGYINGNYHDNRGTHGGNLSIGDTTYICCICSEYSAPGNLSEEQNTINVKFNYGTPISITTEDPYSTTTEDPYSTTTEDPYSTTTEAPYSTTTLTPDLILTISNESSTDVEVFMANPANTATTFNPGNISSGEKINLTIAPYETILSSDAIRLQIRPISYSEDYCLDILYDVYDGASGDMESALVSKTNQYITAKLPDTSIKDRMNIVIKDPDYYTIEAYNNLIDDYWNGDLPESLSINVQNKYNSADDKTLVLTRDTTQEPYVIANSSTVNLKILVSCNNTDFNGILLIGRYADYDQTPYKYITVGDVNLSLLEPYKDLTISLGVMNDVTCKVSDLINASNTTYLNTPSNDNNHIQIPFCYIIDIPTLIQKLDESYANIYSAVNPECPYIMDSNKDTSISMNGMFVSANDDGSIVHSVDFSLNSTEATDAPVVLQKGGCTNIIPLISDVTVGTTDTTKTPYIVVFNLRTDSETGHEYVEKTAFMIVPNGTTDSEEYTMGVLKDYAGTSRTISGYDANGASKDVTINVDDLLTMEHFIVGGDEFNVGLTIPIDMDDRILNFSIAQVIDVATLEMYLIH